MTTTANPFVANWGRVFVVCLALSLGVGCSFDANGGAPLDAVQGTDSGGDASPDAPAGGLRIVTPPSSQLVAINSTVSLSAVVEGQIDKVEWRKKGTVIADAQGLTLVLKNVQVADSGEYELKVSNAVGSAEATAMVTVTAAPAITTRPKAVSAYLGQSATLSVVATGAALAYQWFKDGAAVPGQTADTLMIKNLTLDSAGTYKVSVSNIAGSTSAQAAVTVYGPPVVTTGLKDTTVEAGKTLDLSVAASGAGVSYAWVKDGVPVPGTSSTTTTFSKVADIADAGKYTVTMTNPAGSVTTSATVTVIDVAPLLNTRYIGVVFGNMEYSVTLAGPANRAMTWQWNLTLSEHCVLSGSTDPQTGSATIAAGTASGTEVRRLTFGLAGIGGRCEFGPLTVTGSYL